MTASTCTPPAHAIKTSIYALARVTEEGRGGRNARIAQEKRQQKKKKEEKKKEEEHKKKEEEHKKKEEEQKKEKNNRRAKEKKQLEESRIIKSWNLTGAIIICELR